MPGLALLSESISGGVSFLFFGGVCVWVCQERVRLATHQWSGSLLRSCMNHLGLHEDKESNGMSREGVRILSA